MEQELRRKLTINGEDYHLAVSQHGSGPPAGSTLGKPGVLYLDTEASPERLYICTAANVEAGVYTWRPIEELLKITASGDTTVVPGEDGITPHIGKNGNWYLGDTDTGVRAAGADGENGGYYSPEITPNEADNSFTITFKASKSGMPAAAPATIKLPEKSNDSGQNVEEVDLMTPANFLGEAGKCYMAATGAINNSETWRTYAIAPRYSKYVFRGYIPSYASYPSVGFYSSMEPSESTFIRGIAYPATAELLEIVVTEDDIPEGTQLILFATRIASGEGSALIGTPKNELSLLKDVVGSLVSESRGKGNVKAIFRNIPNSNDFAVIKDEIWFAQNIYENGVATEYTTIHRYKIVDGKLVHISDIDSDFGHWNTVDYCEENDCLIFTNAANLENTDGNYFTVVKNPLALGTVARIADCGIKYSTDYGFKIQAVWGDDNFGKHNIVYLTSNYTANIYKLMLMRDENGDFAKDENGCGTFVELETGTNQTSIGTGGGDYWGDTLYIGNGGAYGYYEMSMTDYSVKKIEKKFYHDDGTAYSGSTQGIHVDSNHIWMFVNVAGLSENYLIQYRR